MTRRPRMNAFGAAGLAHSRMAPGGRMWSERPLARVGAPRVLVMGEAVPEPPEYVSEAQPGDFDNDDGATVTKSLYWVDSMEPGDMVVVMYMGPWTSATLGSEWDGTFVSGSFGGMKWLGAYMILPSAFTAPGLFGSITVTLPGGYAGFQARGYGFRDFGTKLPVAVDVETHTGTSWVFPESSGAGAVLPWQVLGYIGNDELGGTGETTSAIHFDPAWTPSAPGGSSGYFWTDYYAGRIVPTYPGDPPPSGTLVDVTAEPAGTPWDCSWVRMSIELQEP